MTNMIRFIVAAAVALSFSATAQAKPKNSGTKTEKPSFSEESPTRTIAQYSAGGFTHEIDTFFTRGVFEVGENCKDCDSGTNLAVGASYLHYLKDGFQVGFEAGIQMLSDEYSVTGDSETLFTIVGIGVMNFQSDVKNSFYGKAGVGIYPVIDGTEYENQFGFQAGLGKRFALWNNVTYKPEFNLMKRGDLDLGFEIRVLNFGISFDSF